MYKTNRIGPKTLPCGIPLVIFAHFPAIIFSGYLDLVQRLEFGVDHLQKNAVYQIE